MFLECGYEWFYWGWTELSNVWALELTLLQQESLDLWIPCSCFQPGVFTSHSTPFPYPATFLPGKFHQYRHTAKRCWVDNQVDASKQLHGHSWKKRDGQPSIVLLHSVKILVHRQMQNVSNAELLQACIWSQAIMCQDKHTKMNR